MESSYFELNAQKILFEEFEDETVLVNTDSGFYYSISASGTEILKLLQLGCAVKHLPTSLGVPEITEALVRDIETFVARLAEEDIIVSRQLPEGFRAETTSSDLPRRQAGNFISPSLERFDDVRELLLIDPVHQVDQEYGWPKALHESSVAAASSHER